MIPTQEVSRPRQRYFRFAGNRLHLILIVMILIAVRFIRSVSVHADASGLIGITCKADIGELALELQQVAAGRRVNDHRLIAASAMNFTNAMPKALQPPPHLRSGKVDEQTKSLWVGHETNHVERNHTRQIIAKSIRLHHSTPVRRQKQERERRQKQEVKRLDWVRCEIGVRQNWRQTEDARTPRVTPA